MSLKFLLDENVRIELLKFLNSKGFDVKLALKSSPDSQLAVISKKEGRILVTNDQDFSEYSEDKLFAVVWLQVPQNNPKALISCFEKLLKEFNNYEGRLIVLTENSWEDSPLVEEVKI